MPLTAEAPGVKAGERQVPLPVKSAPPLTSTRVVEAMEPFGFPAFPS
jgi:hypothetical protein